MKELRQSMHVRSAALVSAIGLALLCVRSTLFAEGRTATQLLLAVGNGVVLKAEDVTIKVALSASKAVSAQPIGVTVDFSVAPGWHIYGAPLPPEYTVTKVKFDDDLVQRQTLQFPPPTPLKFAALDQTFPIYDGDFRATGDLMLKPKLSPGAHQLGGTIEFQECNDSMCKLPQSLHFELPLTIAATPPA